MARDDAYPHQLMQAVVALQAVGLVVNPIAANCWYLGVPPLAPHTTHVITDDLLTLLAYMIAWVIPNSPSGLCSPCMQVHGVLGDHCPMVQIDPLPPTT